MGHHARGSGEDQKVSTSLGSIAIPSKAIEQLSGCIASDKRGRARKDQIRVPVSAICDEAKRSHAMPEHVLVLLKEVCRSLPEFGRMGGAVERNLFLDTVVSVAIEEYYRT
jgi:hypothetical protein